MDKHKLQFYGEQIMIANRRFDKLDIINWRDITIDRRTWSEATKYSHKLVASEGTYENVVGSTARKRLDKRNIEKITGTLRVGITTTGWHSIQESPFAT